MNVFILAVVYVAVGVALAAVLVVRRRAEGQAAVADAAILLVCWPLYAPFAFSRTTRSPLIDALADLRHGPLAPLLPDDAALDRLGHRLVRATERAAELDRVVTRRGFDPAAAERRAQQMAADGRAGAADAAARTARHLRRLQTLRDRAHAELAEVQERLHQLRAQAEVVRLSGDPGDAAELVAALADRIEGLDDALSDPVLCPGDIRQAA